MPRLPLAALCLVALAGPAAAQPPLERVTYIDRTADGKVTTDVGDVRESPKGVELTIAGRTKVISGEDVLRVDPTSLPGVPAADLQAARAVEDAALSGKAASQTEAYRKAAAAYDGLVKKAASAPERTRRLLAYREAYYLAKAADTLTGADFAPAATVAIAGLTAVVPQVVKSWEVVPTLRTVARMQAELGDLPKAAATLETLAATPGVSRDERIDARLFAAELLVRAKQVAAAAKAVAAAESDPEFALTASRSRADLLKTAAGLPPGKDAVARLQAATDGVNDPAAKAVGYTLLGDARAAAGQAREAIWDYLWVDVVYNGNRAGQVLAVRKLAELFDQQGDKERAEQYRDKLARVR